MHAIQCILRILIPLLFFISVVSGQNTASQADKINQLIIKSQDERFSLSERKAYSLKSVKLANELGIDSLILAARRKLSLIYYYTEDYDNYIDINQRNYALAKSLKDTSALAVATGNLGSYYQYIGHLTDSAYFYLNKSLEYSTYLNDKENVVFMLMSLADILYQAKDYTTSEKNAIAAIKTIKELPKTDNSLNNLWRLYNKIADISSDLKLYEQALEYHDEALRIANQLNDGSLLKVYSINNKAFVYREMGLYKEALRLYESLLPLRALYKEQDPTFYALVSSNIAYIKLLIGETDYKDLSKVFYESLRSSINHNDDVTKMAVAIDLSKFYLKTNEADSSYKYAKEAYQISKNLGFNDYTLDALLTLSKARRGKEGTDYLEEYIRLSDSLLYLERNERNKFARIAFETDQLEAENEQISRENLFLIILSAGLLITALLIYVVISQRSKNRKLRLIKVQQKANEDIYNLMLGQQDKVEEARAKEKKRISQEMHDGVLGRLFGTRLSLDSINFKEGKEAMRARSNYISQLKTIEEDIRKISHELSADFVADSRFIDIVSELIQNQTQAYGLDYTFDYTDDITWESLSNKTKINIYRIIQESMQNIYKHAMAKVIKISISLEKNLICLSINDDGKGFDTSKNKKGIGLKNMISRAESINGELTVISNPGEGTQINVKIPYTNQSA